MILTKAELDLGRLASDDPSRYALSAISVEEKETVVTNGHYLLTVAHNGFKDENFPVTQGLEPAQVTAPVLVHRDAAIAAGKALRKKATIPILGAACLGTDGKLYVNDLESVQAFGSKPEGNFPDWRAVMPAADKQAACTIGFDAKYLRLLADYVEKHGNKQLNVIKLTVYGPTDSAKMEAKTDDGQDITMILMPCRLH
jgi:hypothetical protein